MVVAGCSRVVAGLEITPLPIMRWFTAYCRNCSGDSGVKRCLNISTYVSPMRFGGHTACVCDSYGKLCRGPWMGHGDTCPVSTSGGKSLHSLTIVIINL